MIAIAFACSNAIFLSTFFFFYFSDVAYESAKSLDLVENSSTVLFIESQCN